MKVESTIDNLLGSEIPSVRYKVRVDVLGEDPSSSSIGELQLQIKESSLVTTLLRGRDTAGRIAPQKSVYTKWQGAHWIMATLADIGYPSGDSSLEPIRDQLQKHWLASNYFTEFDAPSKAAAYRSVGVQ